MMMKRVKKRNKRRKTERMKMMMRSKMAGVGRRGVKIRMMAGMAATLAPTSPAREVVMMREVHEIRGGVGAVATTRCR